MSEEYNQYDSARFGEETRQLLATGISALAAQESMGLATDANAEIRRREAAELAADMERKNKENQLRRAAAVTGGLPETPATADQKPKLKGRRKKTMPKQEPSKIMPASHIPEQPVASQQPPVQPAQQPQLPPGLTEADMALIEQVKASRNRAVGNFLENHDTVHPNAFDARPAQSQMAQPSPEYARERLANDPSMIAPQLLPNSEGGWSLSAEAAAIEHRTLTQAAMNPTQQERVIINERNTAAYNGQGNSAYGQPAQYETPVQLMQVQRPQSNFVPPQQPPVQPQQPPQPMYVHPPVFPQEMSYVPPQQPEPAQPAVSGYVPPHFAQRPMQESSGWDDEVDPDATEEEPEDIPEVKVAERAPAIEPSVVHSVKPAPFDPGVPDRDFAAFSEITGMPSQGLFYTDRLFGQGLTTVDADMLSAMDPDDPLEVANTFTAIIGRRVRGINPEDILSADEEFLVYWLRESTYLTESLPKPKFKCEHCGIYVTNREQFDAIGRLGFANQEFTAESDPAAVAAMHAAEGFVRYTLFDGRECAIYLRRRKHDRAIAEYMDGWEKANKKIYPVYRAFNTSIASFIEIEDCETMSEKIRFLEEYPLSKRQEFLKAVYDAQVVSKTFLNIKCPKCGGVARVPYSFQPAPFVASLR